MADLSPLLAARWSPRAFDPSAELTDSAAASLLEAARWAPSAGNSQPWRFLLGRRGDEAYKRIFVHLAGDDQRWAGRAAALLLAAHLTDEAVEPERQDPAATGPAQPTNAADESDRRDTAAIRPTRQRTAAIRAAYDLGQAVAHLTVQAGALGLHVHQLTGFDRAGLAVELRLPDDVHPYAVVAIGRLGDPLSLPEDLRRRETELRRRLPVAELLLG